MNDWTVLDLSGDPTPGDPNGINELGVTMVRQAEILDRHTGRLRGFAENSATLRMRGEYAPKFQEMLNRLPAGSSDLALAYRECGRALADYATALQNAQTQARTALTRGMEADALYRRYLTEFYGLIGQMPPAGGGVWRGLNANQAAYLTQYLAEPIRMRAVAIGSSAQACESLRQQASRMARLAGHARQEAEKRCVARMRACLQRLKPSQQAVHEQLLSELNGNDARADELFNRYYYDYRKEAGEIRKKNTQARYGGHPLPDIERGSDGILRIKAGEEPAIPASYHDIHIVGARKSLAGVRNPDTGHDELEAADTLAQLRKGAWRGAQEASETVKGAPHKDSIYGTSNPLDVWDKKGFYDLSSRYVGQELGEVAGRHFVADLRAKGYQVQRIDVPTGESGRFDQIYRVTAPDGTRSLLVLETKGPTARTVARQGYEQGHPEYFKLITKAMRSRGGTEADIARELDEALAQGKVDYFRVNAKVTQTGGTAREELTNADLEEIRQRVAKIVREEAEARGLSKEDIEELRRELQAQEIDGITKYDGYLSKQFDLGYDSVLPPSAFGLR